MIIVHEPLEETRLQHKLRKKTIFNSISVQWKHQKGLRVHRKEVKLHIEYFLWHFNALRRLWVNSKYKRWILLPWYMCKCSKLLDNHVYSFSWLDPVKNNIMCSKTIDPEGFDPLRSSAAVIVHDYSLVFWSLFYWLHDLGWWDHKNKRAIYSSKYWAKHEPALKFIASRRLKIITAKSYIF